MSVFTFSHLDFILICVGLVFLLLDIVLDIVAVVSFYQERAYASLCILVLLLLGSSVLVQAFSWLWYSYEKFERRTKVEKCLTKWQLKLLHMLQLGIYFSHLIAERFNAMTLCDVEPPPPICVVEVSWWCSSKDTDQDNAVFLSHDLCMLRLIETFSESAPQLVLMLAIMMQRDELEPITVLKALGSASAMALSVTMYHRSLRSFLPGKKKQEALSSVVYFVWNLFLLSSRVAALSLFAAVLPCFIFAHFLSSCVVLSFFVWRSKTEFMDSAWGERLFRATVGLIWYFDWLNVSKGKTRYRTLLYHGYMLVDISLLCGLWAWQMSTDWPYLVVGGVCGRVVVCYILGLLLKMLYYYGYHPNLAKEEQRVALTEKARCGDETDHGGLVINTQLCMVVLADDTADRSGPEEPPLATRGCNKRMRKLAENFYS